MARADPQQRDAVVKTMKHVLLALLCVLAPLAAPTPAHAVRVLELCEVRGVRPNQLVGYGLVVGLNQTGDTGQSRFTLQSTAAMLRRLGATIDPSMIQTRNAAAVMVTATLPPEAQPGTSIDVHVSSLGNARSLLGGTLLQVPLYGADRQVYATAQGALLVGGYGATSQQSGTSSVRNHLTAGRVPEGGLVERRPPRAEVAEGAPVVLSLRSPSHITAQRIEEAVEASLGAGTARALDGATVEVTMPEAFQGDRVRLLAQIQALDVTPDSRARVVVDERTGTVVVGANVRIREVAIAQGGLQVQVVEQPEVSQPGPLAQGTTAVVPRTDITTTEDRGTLHHVQASATLAEIVAALNALGATPRDLITVFQALRTAGALDAELEVQ
jgi:flagellar P-ring protein FlgI